MKQPMTLALLANEITYQRCKMAITQLQSHFRSWKNEKLVEVLFEVAKPRLMQRDFDELTWINQGLNESQKDAITKSLLC